MKKQIEVKDGNNVLLINISTENDYFSITADYLEPLKDLLKQWEMTKYKAGQEGYLIDLVKYKRRNYILTTCGCLHDEILRHRPDLKHLVDLHLSNIKTGEPMHSYANGKYWYNKDIDKGLNYLRANRDIYNRDKIEMPREHLTHSVTFDNIYHNMLPVWEQQAKNGLKFIKTI